MEQKALRARPELGTASGRTSRNAPHGTAEGASGLLSWTIAGAHIHVFEYISQGQTQHIISELHSYGIVLEGEAHGLCG